MSLILALLAAGSSGCDNATTTADLSECLQARYRRSDTLMASQWRVTYAKMKQLDQQDGARSKAAVTYAQALLESQRAWLRYRDMECRIEGYQMRGGSGEGTATAACLIQLTNERTRQLNRLEF